MKRSEMIGIIWEAINELEDADHILTALEKAGMLPPDRNYCSCEECGGPDHTWSREDE